MPSHAYVLTNKVTHARLFPVHSKHAFTYPTIALFVSLDALERSALDLPISFGWGPTLGYVFRFGSIWRTLVGLRGDGYLAHQDANHTSPLSIRSKLDRVLFDSGAITAPSEIKDVWMMTMPAICAFEGINPLTVYYCYRPSGEVSMIVLEVHNTFGEGHVYVLQLGKSEDPLPPKGYDHQWTFPRRFFVSPFNDRSGFYTVAIKLPSHAPFDLSPCDLPKPRVRIHLRMPDHNSTEPAVGPLKIIAHLTPQSSAPLTTLNLLIVLSRFPSALFITFPRIVYEACMLHYRRYLPIFSRPEPIPALPHSPGRGLIAADICNVSEHDHSGGIIYQKPTVPESYARRRFFAFLEQRCAETGVDIALVSGDPSTQTWRCCGQKDAKDLGELSTLTISYTSSRVFTLFLLAPSAHLFFCAGCKSKTDGQCPVFSVSDEDIYMRVFEPGQKHSNEHLGWIEWATQRMRSVSIPRDIFPGRAQLCHPLAALPSSSATRLFDFFVVTVLVIQDWILEKVFCMFRVRFVAGTEPWMKDIWRKAQTTARKGQR
ncbi:hypothetical protein L210DRAFT_3404335 [Boletus edulis BED1]|uniref:Uncharacterized protein n=1 Tax=Boletus edulis BED1 TaxID=1328754 RepID=A0AAD4BSQ1_BOLED|nr:hypothetical protein L210DRAFT_3404335 [Boletus edulis BED1]